MSQAQRADEFDELSPAERILRVQELWDRIAADPEKIPVTDAQRAELDRRLAAHVDDPSATVPWDEVKALLRARK